MKLFFLVSDLNHNIFNIFKHFLKKLPAVWVVALFVSVSFIRFIPSIFSNAHMGFARVG
jgi:hypothetical protein